MPRQITVHECELCGYESREWFDECPDCAVEEHPCPNCGETFTGAHALCDGCYKMLLRAEKHGLTPAQCAAQREELAGLFEAVLSGGNKRQEWMKLLG